MYTIAEKTSIDYALSLIEEKARISGELFSTPEETAKYCQLLIGAEEREVFAVLFLNSQYQLITAEKLFFGTISAASVWPREVAKRALINNAAAVVYCHNHPSGLIEPSEADKRLTERLKAALGLFDITSLDHIIVGPTAKYYSFAKEWII
jgi:DNA repair protein RadC